MTNYDLDVIAFTKALMELGSAEVLQAAERAHQLEPKDAKVMELLLGQPAFGMHLGSEDQQGLR